MAHMLATGIFATDCDFVDYRIASDQINARIDLAVQQTRRFVDTERAVANAAE
ncbi:hypothetical protein ABKW30_21740 [Phyllobacterium sp. SB3]